MSYIPTPEKLAALGFGEGNEYLLFHAYLRNGWTDHSQLLIVYNDGHVQLKGDDGQRWLFTLPSEDFFDQLLIAVGWQPAP